MLEGVRLAVVGRREVILVVLDAEKGGESVAPKTEPSAYEESPVSRKRKVIYFAGIIASFCAFNHAFNCWLTSLTSWVRPKACRAWIKGSATRV